MSSLMLRCVRTGTSWFVTTTRGRPRSSGSCELTSSTGSQLGERRAAELAASIRGVVGARLANRIALSTGRVQCGPGCWLGGRGWPWGNFRLLYSCTLPAYLDEAPVGHVARVGR